MKTLDDVIKQLKDALTLVIEPHHFETDKEQEWFNIGQDYGRDHAIRLLELNRAEIEAGMRPVLTASVACENCGHVQNVELTATFEEGENNVE